MKTILFLFIGTSLTILSIFSFSRPNTNEHGGRCTGSASCSACSNCSRCGHCSSGGTCGVCRGSSSGRSFYSSGSTSKKKKKISYSKPSSNSVSRGFSSVTPKKKPIYYYNSNTSVINDNLLYTIYKSVNIRSGAGTNFSILETVPLNTKLIFLDTENDWYKVKIYDSGNEGYVYKKSVK